MGKAKKGPRSPSTSVKNQLDEGECELFLDAFYQGQFAKEEKFSLAKNKKLNKANAAREDKESELFLQAVNFGISKVRTIEAKAVALPTHSRPKAKKRSLLDAYLDLHGYSAEDAIFALLKFFEREKKRGSRTLLVVHGKGTGIVKNAVYSVVDTHPLVRDYQVAPAKYGGEGAIIIRINYGAKGS